MGLWTTLRLINLLGADTTKFANANNYMHACLARFSWPTGRKIISNIKMKAFKLKISNWFIHWFWGNNILRQWRGDSQRRNLHRSESSEFAPLKRSYFVNWINFCPSGKCYPLHFMASQQFNGAFFIRIEHHFLSIIFSVLNQKWKL